MDIFEREVAADILIEVLENKLYSDVALRRGLSRHKQLEQRQRGFVTLLVMGVLKELLMVDAIIAAVADKQRVRPFVMAQLRLGVYQLVMLKTAPHAVCNEAVTIVKKRGHRHAAGFVNAVLRNVSRLPSGYQQSLLADKDDVERLSLAYSVAPWIVRRFVNDFGVEVAENICKDSLEERPVNIFVNTNRATADDVKAALEKSGVIATRGHMPHCLTLTKTGDISALPAFKGGLFHVMGQSSVAAAYMAAEAAPADVLDLCAAPGGKAFALAALLPNSRITAQDINTKKLDNLKQSAARLGHSITAIHADATAHNPAYNGGFDLVLADVPCSGLGVLSRRPEIKLLKQESDIEGLIGLQRRILTNAQSYVKAGGRLLFSTCTLNSEENQGNLDWLLKTQSLKLIKSNIQMPYENKSDGFFIAIMEKNG